MIVSHGRILHTGGAGGDPYVSLALLRVSDQSILDRPSISFEGRPTLYSKRFLWAIVFPCVAWERK
jgi:hypothetical protein